MTQVGFPHWAFDAPHRLVYASASGGRWQLYCRDLATGAQRQVTDTVAGTTHGSIDPSGRWVWWFDDTLGDELGTWHTAPFDGGPSQSPPLPLAYSAGLALGRELAVVGSCADARSTVTVLRPDTTAHTIYAHPEVASVVALSADDALLCVEHSEHGDSRHPALRVMDLTGGRVANLWDGPGLGLHAGPWSPVPGDARLLVHHEREGIRRPGVWSPCDGGWLPITVDLPGDVDAQWYPEGDRLLLCHEWAGRAELYRFDLGAATLRPLEMPPGSAEAVRVRPDGTVWSLHSSGGRPPQLLSDGRPLWAPADVAAGAPYADLWAGRVHCFVAELPGTRPHPTILILHGGPAHHHRDAFCARVQAWVDHGFAAVLVNYRGSTGYGRAWRDALQHEPGPGLSELEDLAVVRDRLLSEGIADPRRIVLEGGSWGGYLTLLALGRQPELWSLGIAVVPVADWTATYEDEMAPARAHDRALFGCTPKERPEYYAERSPITYVDRVRAPVLIVAGRNDPHCPKRQIDNYVRQLDAYAKTYELHEFHAGHGSLDIHEQILQHERQVHFANRHLHTPSAH